MSSHSEANVWESRVATITNGHVNDLRWLTEQQRPIIEVHVLAEDYETLHSPSVPNFRIRRGY